MEFDLGVQKVLTETEVFVVVTHYSPAVKGNRNGHPDNWTPDEGAELEYTLFDGERDCEVEEVTEGALHDEILKRIKGSSPDE